MPSVFKNNDFNSLDKYFRINLINSITGLKPANLVCSQSNTGIDNVAIFSSVVHIGSNPPLIGFTIRPQKRRKTDTYSNLKENPFLTINSIQTNFIDKAHLTSGKFNKDESEFEKIGINKIFLENFDIPFVEESAIKIGLKKIKEIKLPNDCILIICSVKIIIVDDNILLNDGNIDFENGDIASISGLQSYYSSKKMKTLSYVSKSSIKDFK